MFARIRFMLSAALGMFAAPLFAHADQPPVELELVTPPDVSSKRGAQWVSGWPMSFRAVIRDPLGIYALSEGGAPDPIAVVIADPGGCFEGLLLPEVLGPCLAEGPPASFVEFSIDRDSPGQLDSSGDNQIRFLLTDQGGGGPPAFDAFSSRSVELGPPTGGDIFDGYGYGPNDDWPGLVVLSNHGVGLVLDQSFNLPAIPTHRNLAGFVEDVSFDLTNSKGQTAVHGQMSVPTGLFSILMQADWAVGEANSSGDYAGAVLYRVDGGPLQTGSTNRISLQYQSIARDARYDVRIFLVAGVAPRTLTDNNADGVVDSLDAMLAGYRVLSNELLLNFRKWGTWDSAESGPVATFLETRELGSTVVSADFDGNGVARPDGGGDIGPGRIPPVPR